MDTKATKLWYDKHAGDFKNATAIELPFLEMSSEEQGRLNRFMLHAIESGEHVQLEGRNVLEFGAGHGRLAIEIPTYASYQGVDVCAPLVEIGLGRIASAGLSDRASLLSQDCLEYDGPKGTFDVVCSLGMFPYLEDAEVVLTKMVQHVKPGGIVFFDGYYSSPLYDLLRKLRWKLSPPTGGACRLYSEKELREMCERAGLTKVHTVMQEYPFLSGQYAHKNRGWALRLRNWLAAHPWFDFLGTDCLVFGTKK